MVCETAVLDRRLIGASCGLRLMYKRKYSTFFTRESQEMKANRAVGQLKKQTIINNLKSSLFKSIKKERKKERKKGRKEGRKKERIQKTRKQRKKGSRCRELFLHLISWNLTG